MSIAGTSPLGLLWRGEPAYEMGAFLRNPMPALLESPNLKRVTTRRAAILSEAVQVARQRIIGWAMAQAVLAGVWEFEDHGTGWQKWIAVAEADEIRLLSSLDCPDVRTGLSFKDGLLWQITGRPKRIVAVDPVSGEIRRQIDPGASRSKFAAYSWCKGNTGWVPSRQA